MHVLPYSGSPSDEPLNADIRQTFSDYDAPVVMHVRLGARRGETLDALRAVANPLERQWESVIGGKKALAVGGEKGV